LISRSRESIIKYLDSFLDRSPSCCPLNLEELEKFKFIGNWLSKKDKLRTKRSLRQLNHTVELLRNFQSLNMMALTKIMKKFSKNIGYSYPSQYPHQYSLISRSEICSDDNN